VTVLTVEHAFELPVGYIDADGDLHRAGAMRLATAADEILPMKDPRVQSLPAYLIVILLSRVVVRLGTVSPINPAVIEGLFSEDLTFLQDLYNRVNGLAPRSAGVNCPSCGARFETEVPVLGGSPATPWTGSTRRSPHSDNASTGPTPN
jgi:hypothetical protein